jgi:cysteine desulfurase
MTDRIYFDHAATTPVLAEARAAMARAMEVWANPSSPHAEGRASRKALEDARGTLAGVLGWRHDVIFTSGASEAIAIVAKRARLAGRAMLATEHDIVPASMGAGAKTLPVGRDGLVDMAALDAVLA